MFARRGCRNVDPTANSFPWNRPDIYIDQSPLFAADKVTTPLLLLHGASDTNVPRGESDQMYAALKLLGLIESSEIHPDCTDRRPDGEEARMREAMRRPLRIAERLGIPGFSLAD